MQKLTSCTDFVLEQVQERNKEPEYDSFEFMEKVSRYASFLKKPLTLGMFVPCDLDGNVLEEPKGVKCCGGIMNDCDCRGELQYDPEEVYEYQEAKDRVLFHGFEFVKKKFINSEYDYLSNGDIYIFSFWENKWQLNDLFKTVECLIKFEVVLTESAKKEIGL